MSKIIAAAQAQSAPLRQAVFIDKDGTLVEKVPYNIDPAKLRFTPDAVEGLKLLARHGYLLIIITNQSGLARGLFSRSAFAQLQTALTTMLKEQGLTITDFYVCPHSPPDSKLGTGCLCRKPAPGMLHQAAMKHRIDLENSWVIGDTLDDIEAGSRAGCRGVLLDVGNETEWLMSPLREPQTRVATLLEAAHAILASAPISPAVETDRLASELSA